MDGSTNFGIWKERMLLLLEDHGLKRYETNVVVVPTNVQQVEAHHKNVSKSRCIVMDGVKDHIVPLLVDSDACKNMWDTVIILC